MNIPKQLQSENFRFIKIANMSKIPIEKNWTKNNYMWSELNGHNGNYGVVCGYGNLAVIDCDTDELLATVVKDLPKSFTVKTGSGGIHVYFIIDDLEKKIVVGTGENHKGEVQFWGSQVVGAGSIHPNGNKYEVEIDLPIKKITKSELMEVINPFLKKKPIKDVENIGKGMEHDLNVSDIISLGSLEYKGEEYQGAHPFHGSDGGTNFMVNPTKNLWHCFRCNCGGSSLSLLAMKNNIIGCGDELRGENFKKTLEVARKEFPDKIPMEYEEGKLLLPKTGKLISRFANETGKYFENKTLLFYRSVDNTIVKLEKNSDGILGFRTVKPVEFITILENEVSTGIISYDKRLDITDFQEKSLNKNIAEITMASKQFVDKIPRIDKIFTVPMPMIKDDKLVVPKRGYDENLMSWLPEDAPIINKKMELEEAKKIIEFIFREFCFKTDQDKTNAIAGLITPLCRELYKRRTCRTPIVLYSANTPRCGKDYCAGITGIVYEGVPNEDAPVSCGQGGNDEELRKKITSIFLGGRNRFHSSNNKGYINSATFEALATKEYYSDRILGTNKNVMYPNHLELSLSANIGLTYTTDFSKRCVIVNLFFDEEDPNLREFENPMLQDWISSNRHLILSSLYTLIREWFENDMPSGSVKFASFPEWARVVGGIMENAGYENPCENNENEEDVGGDTKLKDMKSLYKIAITKYGDTWVTKRDIMSDFNAPSSDFEGLFEYIDLHERSGKTKFGKMFESFAGRWLSDIKVRHDGNARKARRKYQFIKKSVENVGLGSFK